MAAAVKEAVFKNTSKMPQIFYDVEIGGVKHERVRVLPGSKVTLSVAFGRKHRKVLTETKDAVAQAETQEG